MSLGSSKQTCRLCFNIINDTDFEVMKEILQVVLPRLDPETKDKQIMCRTCHVKLMAAFKFKSMCLDTEDVIFSYTNPEQMPVVDLKGIYLKEKGNVQLTDISENQKICRLCMQVTYGCMSLNEVDVDIIVNYIPEVDISATKDPVICGLCSDSLQVHGCFIKNCLEPREQYIQSYIKTEEIDIKVEENDQDSDSSLHDLFKGTIKNNESKQFSEDTLEIKAGDPLDAPTSSSVQVNKCDGNNYESMLHEDLSVIRMYQCDVCSYETKYKSTLAQHELKHKNPSEIKMFKCNVCRYMTKYKYYLKRHQLKHKAPSEIRMYKCDVCSYETKYNTCLERHQLAHKDPSKLQIFRCTACSYKTKYKNNLIVHQFTHKDPAEIRMYKCNMCSYETVYRQYLKQHQLTHKKPSNIRIYKCDACGYNTKYKQNIKRHQLVHNDPPEIQMYKCDTCTFETKYKKCLKRHQITHKEPPEILM